MVNIDNNIAVQFLQKVKDKDFLKDGKLDSGELKQLLQSDEFQATDGTKFKIDADGEIDNDQALKLLNLILNGEVNGDPAIKELAQKLKGIRDQILNDEALKGLKKPASPIPKEIGEDTLKDKTLDAPSENKFKQEIQNSKGKTIDLKDRGVKFAEDAIKSKLGDGFATKSTQEQFDALIDVFWTNADKDNAPVFRMSEFNASLKLIKQMAGGDANKEKELTKQFNERMINYINTHDNFKEHKELISKTLLGTIQSTDFAGSGDPAYMKDLENFMKDFAIGLGKDTGAKDPADASKLKPNQVLGNYNGDFDGNNFGSLALITDKDGNTQFLEYKTGSPVNKIKYSFGDLVPAGAAPVDPVDPGATPGKSDKAESAQTARKEAKVATETVVKDLKSKKADDGNAKSLEDDLAEAGKLPPIPDLFTSGDISSIEKLLGIYESIDATLGGLDKATAGIDDAISKVQAFKTKLNEILSDPDFLQNARKAAKETALSITDATKKPDVEKELAALKDIKPIPDLVKDKDIASLEKLSEVYTSIIGLMDADKDKASIEKIQAFIDQIDEVVKTLKPAAAPPVKTPAEEAQTARVDAKTATEATAGKIDAAKTTEITKKLDEAKALPSIPDIINTGDRNSLEKLASIYSDILENLTDATPEEKTAKEKINALLDKIDGLLIDPDFIQKTIDEVVIKKFDTFTIPDGADKDAVKDIDGTNFKDIFEDKTKLGTKIESLEKMVAFLNTLAVKDDALIGTLTSIITSLKDKIK